MKVNRKKLLHNILNINAIVGFTLIILSITLFLVPSLPQLWYTLDEEATSNEVENIVTPTITNSTSEAQVVTNKKELPPFNPDLPAQEYVSIPSIGVYSPIYEGSNYNEILKHGTWIVNDFARPDDDFKPVILASHRFGYISWSAQQRKEISFFNLPKVKVGDKISIIWDQREYVYEVTKSEEGRTISDYSSDLILYTCKLYNSPVRIFKYAKRVE